MSYHNMSQAEAWCEIHDLVTELGWGRSHDRSDIPWIDYIKARIAQNHLAVLLTEVREVKKERRKNNNDWTVTIRGNGDFNVNKE